jgi:hypothetical protein
MPDSPCPQCGGAIDRPAGCDGAWSGFSQDGVRAGGGFYSTQCIACGVKLVAYYNVYDAFGRIPDRPAGWNPELSWQLDEPG